MHGVCTDTEEQITAAWQAQQYQTVVQLLLGRYGQEVFRFCLSLVGEQADAEELSQVTFVQAYKDLAGFDGRSSFRTWLYAIARHRCLDWLKAKRRRERRFQTVEDYPEVAVDDNTSGHTQQHRLQALLKTCLEALPAAVRSAVLMRHQLEYSYEEMAEIIGDKAGTLQARVVRSLPKLRQCLEERGAWQ